MVLESEPDVVVAGCVDNASEPNSLPVRPKALSRSCSHLLYASARDIALTAIVSWLGSSLQICRLLLRAHGGRHRSWPENGIFATNSRLKLGRVADCREGTKP